MKRKALKTIAAVSALITIFTFFGCSQEKENARVYIEGTKFMVDGKELWINGINTPWKNWNDFTGSMNEGTLSGDLNIQFWDDMPTLLSFDHFKSSTGVGSGMHWRALISKKETADAYAETYVKEFCDRYKDNDYIFAIDIMNEPDWVFENEECGQIGWDKLSYFFGKCASVIHENSDFLVTVGMGIIKYNSDKYEGNMVSDEYLKELTGLDNSRLDFYSTHYYNWQKTWFGFPCDKSPKEFGIAEEKPCLIGETHNDDEAEIGMSLTEKYKSVYENGWNGIMVWMQSIPEQNYAWYGYDFTKAATSAMAEYIPEKIFPLKNE